MRVAVFGASGGIGRLAVRECLGRGDSVNALVRDVSRLALSDGMLEVVKGDAMQAEDVDRAVAGCEAVLSSLGRGTGAPPNVCSAGAANIVGSMSKNGVKRLVCVSAYGTGETRKGVYARMEWLLIRGLMEDKETMEEVVRSSGLDWTVVRPTRLTDGPKRGRYRTGVDIDVGLFPRVSRADVADFMVNQLSGTVFRRASPTITY